MLVKRFPRESELEYYDDDGGNALPSLRSQLDQEKTGPASSLPELQAAEVGRTVPVGAVYFVETADHEFIKIGYSKEPLRRLSELGPLRPTTFALCLIGHFPASQATEQWLHQKFAKYRDKGEWFRSCDELRRFIETLGLVPPEPERERKIAPQRKREREIVPRRKQEREESPPHQEPSPTLLTVAEMTAMGGKARAKALTKERRQAIAKKAAAARWKKKPKKS